VDDILAACGVTPQTLAQDTRAALERDGYVVLEDVINPPWLAAMRTAFEQAFERGRHETKQGGTRHIAVLAADPVFDAVYTQPRVLAAVWAVLGRPFIQVQIQGRDPLAGHGLQGLHTDWRPRTAGESYRVVTTLWMLDDFTSENGATRLVPGTHVGVGVVPKTMSAPEHRHPKEVRARGRAGSVLVFNGHLWHSGARNDSGAPRRALQCSYVASDEPVLTKIEHPEPGRLSAEARRLIDA
jgi:ectoine hydroxylase-related dioxygenase (phytanoyl-CoA dioxygenase family)